MCFIDLEKAFDRIQLEDVAQLLYDRQVPQNIIKTIENIYQAHTIQARINGDSLSPLLFNIIMDELIIQVRKLKGYKMGDREIKTLCYADDAVLIAESEDELQRLHTSSTQQRKRLKCIYQ